MAKSRKTKKLIIGNWKMYGRHLEDAREIFGKIKRSAAKTRNVKTVICPSFPFLAVLSQKSNKQISVGAQDLYWEKAGAFTGEVSALQIKSAGADTVIIGHSERRAMGETDGEAAKKVKAAAEEGLRSVLCVGEKERDDSGRYLSLVKDEILHSLKGFPRKNIKYLVIAYEPIWAIGGSVKDAVKPEQFEEMRIFIRKVLSDYLGKEAAASVPILYGGSVTSKNAGGLLEIGGADGFLVGRDSLRPEDFGEILKIADNT